MRRVSTVFNARHVVDPPVAFVIFFSHLSIAGFYYELSVWQLFVRCSCTSFSNTLFSTWSSVFGPAWTPPHFTLLKHNAFLKMLTDIFCPAFNPVETCGAKKKSFITTFTEAEQSHMGIPCPPPSVFCISELSPRRNFNSKTRRLEKQPAIQNDLPCRLPPDSSFYSSCYSPLSTTHTFAYFVTQLDISRKLQVFLITGGANGSNVLVE